MSVGDILFGTGARPTSANIVFGTEPETPPPAETGSVLDYTIPVVDVGTTLIALVVHSAPILCSDPVNWRRVINGEGASSLKLTAWKRKITSATQDDSLTFLSVTAQELVGTMLAVNSVDSNLVNAVDQGEFELEANPPAAGSVASSVLDTVVTVFASDDDVAWTPPADCQEVEDYVSSVGAARSLMVAFRRAGQITVDPGPATATPATTGSTWTIVLKYLFSGVGRLTGSLSSTNSLTGTLTHD